MERLRGIANGGGSALGVALVIRNASGFPVLPGMPAGPGQRRQSEPMEVVLVVEEAPQLMFGLPPWIHIVGAVAETPLANGVSVSPIPFVSGIADARSAIPGGSLVLLDGDQGVVLVNPDAGAVAHY